MAAALWHPPRTRLHSSHPLHPTPTPACTTLAACPEPRQVEGLGGVTVAGAAAGLAVSGEQGENRCGGRQGGQATGPAWRCRRRALPADPSLPCCARPAALQDASARRARAGCGALAHPTSWARATTTRVGGPGAWLRWAWGAGRAGPSPARALLVAGHAPHHQNICPKIHARCYPQTQTRCCPRSWLTPKSLRARKLCRWGERGGAWLHRRPARLPACLPAALADVRVSSAAALPSCCHALLLHHLSGSPCCTACAAGVWRPARGAAVRAQEMRRPAAAAGRRR